MVNAPASEIPVPFKVSPSEVASVNPFKSSAPAATIVPAPVVPNGVLGLTPAAPSCNIPALIVVAPVYVFAPERVHVPAPLFVSVPDVVPRMLARLPLPDPTNVKPKVAPVIVPVFVMLMPPALVPMLLAVPSVINPL